MGPPCIRLVCPAHPKNAQYDRDLGNLEVKPTPQAHCCPPQTIPKLSLLCGKTDYAAERGRSHQGIRFPRKVHMICNNDWVGGTCHSITKVVNEYHMTSLQLSFMDFITYAMMVKKGT